MKIKSKLYVCAGISIVLVVILFSLVLVTSGRIAEGNKKYELLDDVRVGVSDLDIVTYDYLLHREERMKQQWLSKYNSLVEILEKAAKEEELISIRADYASLGDLFTQIIASSEKRQKLIQEGASQEKIDAVILLEERLVTLLLITSHSVSTDASRRTEETRAEVTEAQRLATNLTLILMIILAINVTISALLIIRSISKPLDELTKGAEIIGKGNLNHRVEIKTRDELGDLAITFNQMTQNLKAFRDELNKEITERKRAEEALKKSEKRLRNVLDSLGPYMLAGLMTPEGTLIEANRPALEIAGLKPEDVLGKPFEETYWWSYSEPIKRQLRDAICQAARGESSRYDVVVRVGENRFITIDFCLHPLVDEAGRITYLVPSAVDLTERKKAEEAQKRLSIELAGKNKELEQIIYVTSHDLRSPLVNVQGFGKELEHSLNKLSLIINSKNVPEDVKKKVASIIEEEIPEDMKYILTGISKMDSLLNGLLKLSRTGRASIKIKKLDMNELISKVVSIFEFQIKETGAKLEISKLPPCKGDMEQINQVFSNLLDNALKFLNSKRKGAISISGYREDNRSIYCIEDNGLGITPEHQEKIFEIFYQLIPEEKIGEGLGLTIVGRILDRHKGKIWVESEVGKGSKFYVELPG